MLFWTWPVFYLCFCGRVSSPVAHMTSRGKHSHTHLHTQACSLLVGRRGTTQDVGGLVQVEERRINTMSAWREKESKRDRHLSTRCAVRQTEVVYETERTGWKDICSQDSLTTGCILTEMSFSSLLFIRPPCCLCVCACVFALVVFHLGVYVTQTNVRTLVLPPSCLAFPKELLQGANVQCKPVMTTWQNISGDRMVLVRGPETGWTYGGTKDSFRPNLKIIMYNAQDLSYLDSLSL